MNVIVLGGAGDMGSRAVEDLAATPDVTAVTIADRNKEEARRIAASLAESRARIEVAAVDATDHSALVKAMRGHDVAASALGPFHRFEAPLVRAAIDAGVDYVSVCDEWEAVEAVIAESDAAARSAGRIIVTGLGASPGITNVGVRYLADRMDRLRKAEIYCYQPLDAGGGPAVIQHMLFIMSGNVEIRRGGRQVRIPALAEERRVDFPRFGEIQLWNMGHSEPFTIPMSFPDVEEVGFFMGFGKGSGWLVNPARWGWFSTPSAVDRGARFVSWLEGLSPTDEPGWGALRIDAWGDSGGAPVHRSLCGIGQMRDATGLALSVGTLLVGRKQLSVTEGGVYAPEACIPPEPFISAMSEKGIGSYEDLEMTRPIEF